MTQTNDRLTRPGMMAQFMRCRTLGHQWDDIPAEKPGTFGDPLWCRCLRCTMVRIDEIGGGGKLVKRRYVRPDGYQHAFTVDGGVAPTRSDFREMLLMQRIREARNGRKR